MMNLNAEQIDRITHKVMRRLRRGDQSSALRILQDNGFEAEAALLGQTSERLVQHDLQCPAHRAAVSTACRGQTCKFWVSSDMANNCLLAYCAHQQVDRLNADEIAYLYGQPIEIVRDELESAMTTLRITAIQSDAVNDPDIQRAFWFVESPTVCCVCGSLTDPATLIRAQDTKLAYCSRECWEETPPDVLGCEYRFGLPIGTIMRWAIHRFRNLPVMEKTLGLKRETLIELSRRHLGRDLVGFFPKVKMQSERPSWRRRTNGNDVAGVLVGLGARTEQHAARFGQAIFTINHLRDALQGVLI